MLRPFRCFASVIVLLVLMLPSLTNTYATIIGDNYWVYKIPDDAVDYVRGSYGIIGWVNRANSTIYGALAFFENMSLAEALVDARNRGVDVRIVVDDDSLAYDAVQYMIDNGVDVVTDESYEQTTSSEHTMHMKFLVIDNETVLFGTSNPTTTGMGYNYETVLVLRSSSLAYYFLKEFDELYGGTFGGGANISGCLTVELIDANGTRSAYVCVYFGPEHLLNETLLQWIQRANTSIYFSLYIMTTSASIRSILNAIIEKNNTGVDVRGVFDNELMEDYRYSAYFWLYRNGTRALAFERSPYKLHDKLFVIDNNTVLVGSYNPTGRATTSNDELLVVVRDQVIAEYLADKILTLWREWYDPQWYLGNEKWIAPHPVINEVYIEPGGNTNEWIEIYNPTGREWNITGWVLADYYGIGPSTSTYECAYKFPNYTMQPYEFIIVAYDAVAFEQTWGFKPTFEIAGTDPTVPDMIKDTGLCQVGPMDLYERYDEVILYRVSYDFYIVIDAVWWANESAGYNDWYISEDGYGQVDISNLKAGYSIQRIYDGVDGPIPRQVFAIESATPYIGYAEPIPEPTIVPILVAATITFTSTFYWVLKRTEKH